MLLRSSLVTRQPKDCYGPAATRAREGLGLVPGPPETVAVAAAGIASTLVRSRTFVERVKSRLVESRWSDCWWTSLTTRDGDLT